MFLKSIIIFIILTCSFNIHSQCDSIDRICVEHLYNNKNFGYACVDLTVNNLLSESSEWEVINHGLFKGENFEKITFNGDTTVTFMILTTLKSDKMNYCTYEDSVAVFTEGKLYFKSKIFDADIGKFSVVLYQSGYLILSISNGTRTTKKKKIKKTKDGVVSYKIQNKVKWDDLGYILLKKEINQ